MCVYINSQDHTGFVSIDNFIFKYVFLIWRIYSQTKHASITALIFACEPIITHHWPSESKTWGHLLYWSVTSSDLLGLMHRELVHVIHSVPHLHSSHNVPVYCHQYYIYQMNVIITFITAYQHGLQSWHIYIFQLTISKLDISEVEITSQYPVIYHCLKYALSIIEWVLMSAP